MSFTERLNPPAPRSAAARLEDIVVLAVHMKTGLRYYNPTKTPSSTQRISVSFHGSDELEKLQSTLETLGISAAITQRDSDPLLIQYFTPPEGTQYFSVATDTQGIEPAEVLLKLLNDATLAARLSKPSDGKAMQESLAKIVAEEIALSTQETVKNRLYTCASELGLVTRVQEEVKVLQAASSPSAPTL
jgi:hypothetical protein